MSSWRSALQLMKLFKSNTCVRSIMFSAQSLWQQTYTLHLFIHTATICIHYATKEWACCSTNSLSEISHIKKHFFHWILDDIIKEKLYCIMLEIWIKNERVKNNLCKNMHITFSLKSWLLFRTHCTLYTRVINKYKKGSIRVNEPIFHIS